MNMLSYAQFCPIHVLLLSPAISPTSFFLHIFAACSSIKSLRYMYYSIPKCRFMDLQTIDSPYLRIIS